MYILDYDYLHVYYLYEFSAYNGLHIYSGSIHAQLNLYSNQPVNLLVYFQWLTWMTTSASSFPTENSLVATTSPPTSTLPGGGNQDNKLTSLKVAPLAPNHH